MTFLHCSYHSSARPGELDEAELSTFRHTFFSFFFLLGAEGRCSGWGSGAPQSACPSLSYWIMKRCSSFFLNLKNISSLPIRKQISPFPTSILALADLRKGRPSTRSTPRSPSYPLLQSRQGRRSLVLIQRRVRLSLRDTGWSNLQAVRAWLRGKE